MMTAQNPVGSIGQSTKVGFEKCATESYMAGLLKDPDFADEFYKNQAEIKKKIK